MRRLVSMERTQLINHVRGLLAEYGIVFSKGATELRQKLPALLEDAENELTDTMRTLLHRQYIRLITLDNELSGMILNRKNMSGRILCANGC